jgi:hypothetical protein
MDHPTRAALVAMGNAIDRAREVLAVTERRSMRTVYELEFKQLNNVVKSPKATDPPSPSPRRGARKEGRKDSEIAADILARRRGGDTAPLNASEVAKHYGVGHKTADTAINAALFAEQEVVSALTDHTDVDASDLPDEWKEKYERIQCAALFPRHAQVDREVCADRVDDFLHGSLGISRAACRCGQFRLTHSKSRLQRLKIIAYIIDGGSEFLDLRLSQAQHLFSAFGAGLCMIQLFS